MFDCKLPDDAEREMILLSICYRSFVGRPDRSAPESVLGESIDEFTGLVRDESDLLPEGQGLRGRDLTLSMWLDPEDLSLACLLRNEVDGSKPCFKNVRGFVISTTRPERNKPGQTKEVRVGLYPTSERGRAEEEALHLAKDHPDWTGVRVVEVVGREAMRPEEHAAAVEFKHLLNRTLHQMAEKGLVSLTPPVPFEPAGPENLPVREGSLAKYTRGESDTGMSFGCRFLDAAIEESVSRCANDPAWAKGPTSPLESQSTEVRAAAVSRNPWAVRKADREAQGS